MMKAIKPALIGMVEMTEVPARIWPVKTTEIASMVLAFSVVPIRVSPEMDPVLCEFRASVIDISVKIRSDVQHCGNTAL